MAQLHLFRPVIEKQNLVIISMCIKFQISSLIHRKYVYIVLITITTRIDKVTINRKYTIEFIAISNYLVDSLFSLSIDKNFGCELYMMMSHTLFIV